MRRDLQPTASYVLQRMLDAAEPGMTTRELDVIGEKLLTRGEPIVVTRH